MNTKITCLLIAATALFAGCESLGVSAPKMDQPESVARVKEALTKHIDTTKYKPISINWFEGEELSNLIRTVQVEMVGTDGKIYRININVGGTDLGSVGDIAESQRSGTFDYATVPHLTVNDIEADVVMAQLNAATPQIDTALYNIRSVSDYCLRIDPVNNKRETFFELRVTDKKNATEVQGRRIITTYYEVGFNVAPDGTVTMEE